jgi:hypothetical protein
MHETYDKLIALLDANNYTFPDIQLSRFDAIGAAVDMSAI